MRPDGASQSAFRTDAASNVASVLLRIAVCDRGGGFTECTQQGNQIEHAAAISTQRRRRRAHRTRTTQARRETQSRGMTKAQRTNRGPKKSAETDTLNGRPRQGEATRSDSTHSGKAQACSCATLRQASNSKTLSMTNLNSDRLQLVSTSSETMGSTGLDSQAKREQARPATDKHNSSLTMNRRKKGGISANNQAH